MILNECLTAIFYIVLSMQFLEGYKLSKSTAGLDCIYIVLVAILINTILSIANFIIQFIRWCKAKKHGNVIPLNLNSEIKISEVEIKNKQTD
jgi:hypothetical protein